MDRETRLKMKREYEEICEELDKIEKFLEGRYKPSQDENSKRALKLLRAYKDFYTKCAKSILSKDYSLENCEPAYKDFYYIYSDRKDFMEDLKNGYRREIESNLKSIKSNLKDIIIL